MDIDCRVCLYVRLSIRTWTPFDVIVLYPIARWYTQRSCRSWFSYIVANIIMCRHALPVLQIHFFMGIWSIQPYLCKPHFRRVVETLIPLLTRSRTRTRTHKEMLFAAYTIAAYPTNSWRLWFHLNTFGHQWRCV